MSTAALRGIEFVVDESGQRRAVLIDLKRHSVLWEDLYDTLVAHQRRAEPRESLAEVKRRLARGARKGA